MGGFKEGSVNGWDDDAATNDSPTGEDTSADTESSDETTAENKSNNAIPNSDSGSTATESKSADGSIDSTQIPWLLRRNSITDGRTQTVQLHLQAETLALQREQKTTIESALGEPVKKADLREAALLVGLQHPDAVSRVLREWGYALE